MPKRKGDYELSQAKLRGIFKAKRNLLNKSNYPITKRYKYSKKISRNILKRASNAEKENIDPLSSKASIV